MQVGLTIYFIWQVLGPAVIVGESPFPTTALIYPFCCVFSPTPL